MGQVKISKKIFLVFPHPMGILNQKNLWPTLIYQFEHLGHPHAQDCNVINFVPDLLSPVAMITV